MLDRIRNKKKLWCGIIILEFIIMGVWAILPHADRSYAELNFKLEDLIYESGEAGFYLDQSYSQSYILTPEFTLPKGFYTLYAECEYSGQVRLEVVHPDGGVNSNISNSMILDGLTEISGDFKVRYSDRTIRVQGRLAGDASDGDYILIRNLRIVPNNPLTVRNKLFDLVIFLLAADIILFFIFSRDHIIISDEQRMHLKILIALTIVVSVPLMVNYLFNNQHDLRFHLTRIEGLKESLLDGNFPVRMQSHWLHGHGYPVSVFYGDILLYIPAILRVFGVSIQAAYNFYVLMINVGTVFIGYYCFSKMSNSTTGLVCTTIYSLNIYRLNDIYTRAAVGEYTAIMFMPLVLYGMWSIYTRPEESEEHGKSWIPLTIGCIGIFLSHMLSTEMTAFFVILAAVLLWRKTLRKKTLFVLLKAAAVTMLLSVWLLVPFLDYMTSDMYVVSSSAYGQYRLDTMGIYPAQLFMSRHSALSGSTNSGGIVSDMMLTPGLASMCILAGWFVFCVCKKRDDIEKKEEYLAVFLCILSLAMTLYLFPYTWLVDKFPILEMLVKSLQFPWRFYAITGVLLLWLLCIVMKKHWIARKKRQIFVGAILLIAFWQGISYMTDVLNESDVYRVFQKGNLSTMNIINAEYIPVEPDEVFNLTDFLSKCVEQLTYEGESVNILEWHRDKGNVVFSLVNLTQQTQQVEVPLINYKGYHALAESGEELQIMPGTSHRISVSVPAGYSGTIQVGFSEPWYWRICELVSFITLLWLIFYPFIKNHLNKQRIALK